MQRTNFDNSLDMKPVMFEHDYCRNGDIRDVVDCKDNVFGKKRSRDFGAVDKWTQRILVNVTTGGDWSKIVDRETAILKVQYPFLPEQQLRGKAYKKFGIPTVMGGMLSRGNSILGGAERMSRYQEVEKSKNLSQFDSNDKDGLEKLIEGWSDCKISSKEAVPPDINDAVSNTIRSTIGTDDTESLTPNFGFPDIASIHSKPTQRFKQYTRPSDTPDGIYSATTQEIDRNFQEFHNRGDINDNLIGRIWNRCENSQRNNLSTDSSTVNQSISSAEMSTQKNINNNNRHGDFNRNFLKVTFPLKEKAQSFSLRPAVIFPGKTSNEQKNVPIFDIVDIDDFSQLATPNFGPFTSPKLSGSQSSSDPTLNNDNFNHYRKTPEEPKQILINNELKRKRQADRRAITNTENKENGPVIINFQHEKLRAKKLGFSTNAKNPSHLDDTLTLDLQARHLNLNDLSNKSKGAYSPDSASPENKKRRLSLQDSPISASLFPRGRKTRLHIVGVTQGKNTTKESTVVLRNNAEEKPASEVKLPTIASYDSSDVETIAESSLDFDGDNGKQNVSRKFVADEKQCVIFAKNPTEKSGDASSSDSASPDKKKRRLMSFQHPPTFYMKKYGSTPFYPRGRKERVVAIINLTQEDDTNVFNSFNDEENETAEESLVVLKNNAGEKPSAKPASEVKLSKIANNDSWNIRMTAESSVDGDKDDGKQNVSQKFSSLDLNDVLDPEATVESPTVSLTDGNESSPSSATTNFTQTISFSSKLLSDRCSEYDQFLQDENLSHRNFAENTIGVSNSIARFYVDIDVIYQQVDNILQFLEADIAAN